MLESLYKGIKVASDIYGSEPDILVVSLERESLKKRLSTLVQTRAADIKMIVIDNADEILIHKQNREFIGGSVILTVCQPQIPNIPNIYFAQSCPSETVFKFVAELENNFRKIYNFSLSNLNITYPLRIVQKIDQFYLIYTGDVVNSILNLISSENYMPCGGVLIYCNTREGLIIIENSLRSNHQIVQTVDLEIDEVKLVEFFKSFREGVFRFMLCTSIPSKFQMLGIGCIIHVGLPSPDMGQSIDCFEYEERVSRLYSHYKSGYSILMLTEHESSMMRALEIQIERSIPLLRL